MPNTKQSANKLPSLSDEEIRHEWEQDLLIPKHWRPNGLPITGIPQPVFRKYELAAAIFLTTPDRLMQEVLPYAVNHQSICDARIERLPPLASRFLEKDVLVPCSTDTRGRLKEWAKKNGRSQNKHVVLILRALFDCPDLMRKLKKEFEKRCSVKLGIMKVTKEVCAEVKMRRKDSEEEASVRLKKELMTVVRAFIAHREIERSLKAASLPNVEPGKREPSNAKVAASTSLGEGNKKTAEEVRISREKLRKTVLEMNDRFGFSKWDFSEVWYKKAFLENSSKPNRIKRPRPIKKAKTHMQRASPAKRAA